MFTSRFTNGFTQNSSFQPFGQMGIPDPVWMMQDSDDMFNVAMATGYTVSATGNGAVTKQNVAGGVVLFTTNTSTPLTTDYVSIQRPNGNFQLSSSTKTAFVARISLADIVNPSVDIGLIDVTSTPFSDITDGIYLSTVSGGSTWSLIARSGNSTVGSAALNFTPVANTFFDIGFLYTPEFGNVIAFAGSNLVGNKSGSQEDRALLGPVARITPTALTSALLSPTISIQSGT